MSKWETAPGVCYCGRCGGLINAGCPRLAISAREGWTKRKFWRCVVCAGEPVPADVPVMADDDRPQSFVFASRFDGKAAAIAREPGEEG